MSNLDSAMGDVHTAVAELSAAGEHCGGSWTTPRAQGKWSPSQIVEHVARAFDESADVALGKPTKFPTFPFFVQPLVRGVFFNRILKTGKMPKAKTNAAMNPDHGQATAAEGRVRLNEA